MCSHFENCKGQPSKTVTTPVPQCVTEVCQRPEDWTNNNNIKTNDIDSIFVVFVAIFVKRAVVAILDFVCDNHNVIVE